MLRGVIGHDAGDNLWTVLLENRDRLTYCRNVSGRDLKFKDLVLVIEGANRNVYPSIIEKTNED